MGCIELFAFDLKEPEFQLDGDFVDAYKGRQPEWGPVGYVTYKRTYARALPDGGTEEYWQTCQRVVEGVYQIQQRHSQVVHTPWITSKAQRSAQKMFELMWDFKFLPPGRGLWMMGTPFIKSHGSAALQNCGFASTQNIATDFASPFCFLMDMSMLGVGVGGDVRGAGTLTISEPTRSDTVRTIPDTREGWVAAVRTTINSYAGVDTLPMWDYSAIRKYGEPIKGFGGVAAGSECLRILIEEDLPSVLSPLVGRSVTKTAIVDIFNFIGKCVVAGNVRRTAEIMFGDDSDEFLDLKNPELHEDELKDRRWASNNSLFAHTGMDYGKSSARTMVNGEPGYLWLDNVRAYGRMVDPPNNADHRVVGANPCNEQSLEDRELCNLVETFPATHESYDEYQTTLKYAYLYAKTVTLIPTHNKQTNRVMMRNRRIGTSMSGIVQAFQKIGRRELFRWCDKGYNYLRSLDEVYSEWMCVRPSIKITSVKPSGTVSKLAGTTCGVHYPPAEYYIQRIRFAHGSPLLQQLIDAGYPHEKCLYGQNTEVVEFPVHEQHFYKAESDVSLWEQVGNAVQMQKWWADNQVSCTVKFKAREACDIQAALELYDDQLKGISFLPQVHGYEQAPWEPICRAEYSERLEKLTQLQVVEDIDTHEVTEKFCDGDTCQIAL